MKNTTQTKTKNAGRIVMMTEYQNLKTNSITVSLVRIDKKPLVGSPLTLSTKPEVVRHLSKKMAIRLGALAAIESNENLKLQRSQLNQSILRSIPCAA